VALSEEGILVRHTALSATVRLNDCLLLDEGLLDVHYTLTSIISISPCSRSVTASLLFKKVTTHMSPAAVGCVHLTAVSRLALTG
jgi:hypothetical protein